MLLRKASLCGGLTLYLGATITIVSNLSIPWLDGCRLLLTVFIPNANGPCNPVPLLEFLTNQQDVRSVISAVYAFIRR